MGEVEDLKVGTLYLQQLQDSSLVNLDSMVVDGDPNFDFTAEISEPQLLYLYLDKKDRSKYDDRLAFFTGDSTMTIHTTLENFAEAAEITGSTNQQVLEEFRTNKEKLDLEQMQLMQMSMRLQDKDTVSRDSIAYLTDRYERHLRRRYLYTLNFARTHANHEVAPYLLISEAFDANPSLLDSIYQAMPKEVQSNRYGKQLKEQIDKLKTEMEQAN